MDTHWSWEEGLKFGLAREFLSNEENLVAYQMSPAEKFGALVLKFPYRIIDLVSRHIRKPLAICLFTLLSVLLSTLVFYNILTFALLEKIFLSYVLRFLFFLYVELVIFALGCRAFGRFNNKVLIVLWKNGQLVPILLR